MADIPTIVNSLLLIAGAISPILVIYIVKARSKLSQFRKFVDVVDDAAQDNSVTEAEFQAILAAAKELVA